MIQINLAESDNGIEVFMTSIDETAPTMNEIEAAGLMLDALNVKIVDMSVDFDRLDAERNSAELKAKFNRRRFSIIEGEDNGNQNEQ